MCGGFLRLFSTWTCRREQSLSSHYKEKDLLCLSMTLQDFRRRWDLSTSFLITAECQGVMVGYCRWACRNNGLHLIPATLVQPEKSLGSLALKCFLRTLFARTCLSSYQGNSKEVLEIHRSLKPGRVSCTLHLLQYLSSSAATIEWKFHQPKWNQIKLTWLSLRCRCWSSACL